MIKLKTNLFFLIFANLFAINLCMADDQTKNNIWNEYGIPLYRNYTPKEYGGHFQNWGIIQDKNGIILVANNDGLLAYDGVNWKRYDLNGKLSSLRSLALDDAGTIFCGTGSQFGYISYDTFGNYNFISLIDKVNKKYRNFNDVWYTLVLDRLLL
ncbi:MAG: hypothetical protein P8Z35_02550 [Ignavibacteriaceae bacterium]